MSADPRLNRRHGKQSRSKSRERKPLHSHPAATSANHNSNSEFSQRDLRLQIKLAHRNEEDSRDKNRDSHKDGPLF